MPKRLRTFIGTIILTLFIPAYALAAMVVASLKLPGTSILVQTISYAALGLFWVLPAGLVIMWMQRPDRPQT